MADLQQESHAGPAWSQICATAIQGLLKHAGTYTPEDEQDQLQFINDFVGFWIGPKPRNNTGTARSPLEVASPLEASLNFSSKGKAIVRYQFEPLKATKYGRSDVDPFAENITRAVLDDLQKKMPGVDLRWTNQFMQSFIPRGLEEIGRVRAAESQLPEPLDHALAFNLAFDLDGGSRRLKNYFLPMAKTLATDLTGEAVTFNTIRGLDPYGPELTAAVDLLEGFLKSATQPITIVMIGMDAVDSSKARIKIYGHATGNNSWDFVRTVSTFGGIARDETRLKGLEILRSIWHLLLGDDEPIATTTEAESASKPQNDQRSFLGSTMFSFELTPGVAHPQVKIYVPLWQYAPSDRVIARNLSRAFALLGWQDAAENYEARLAQCFPGANLDGPSILHSNVSFSYSNKTGAYMSVYYAVSEQAVGSSKE